ncbi:MAG TPA: EAL domain-containing protein [Gammaproteobacteria bacterium]|nr:EAL domain-containing protein [Gammaproteobacteria bacterium]
MIDATGAPALLAFDAYHFAAFAAPNFTVAVATLLWGLLLRWRESDSSTGTWALAVSVSVAAWQIGYALGYIAPSAAEAQQWIVLGQVGIIFIGPSLYELLRRLLGLSDWRNRLSPLLWLWAFGFLALLLATTTFLGPPYHYPWGYYAHYRLGGTLLASSLCATLVFLFICSLWVWRASPRGSGRRHRARILLIGFSVSFIAATDFLGCWGFAVYPFGYVMVAFTVVTIGYAAWRYRVISVSSGAAAEQVLTTLSDGVLVLDDLGAVAVANERAAELLGRERTALLGQPVTQVLPAADIEQMLTASESADVSHTEVELTGEDGRNRILNVTVNTRRGEPAGAALTVLALQDVTRYREAADRIRELVYFDQTSGLPNRRHLHDKLNDALARVPPEQGIAVCALRLEHVRHLAGASAGMSADPMLSTIVRRIKAFCDTAPPGLVAAAHVESREFVLLFEQVESVARVVSHINRLNEALREPVVVAGHVQYPVLWLGISLYPNDGHQAEPLLERAAAAMDQAAAQRSENAHFFNVHANAAALQALALDARLARAIDADELRAHFQPMININTGTIDCAEALARWHDPHHGLRLPDEFIPVAEQSGLVVALDRWMLKTACHEAAQWRGAGDAPPPRVAVNVSGAHLIATQGADIADTIGEILGSAGLPPERLEIEITETKAVTNDERVLENLRRIRALGVRIAVDDFGTGYASLSYLQQFPLDSLKIDRSYVMAIGNDQRRTALLKSILHLASQLGLEVVAEGVEAPHQAAFLRRQGCDLVQGYLFCRPLAAEDFVRFAAGWAGHTDVSLRLLNQAFL